jgi:hypothetical protein
MPARFVKLFQQLIIVSPVFPLKKKEIARQFCEKKRTCAWQGENFVSFTSKNFAILLRIK